MDHHARSPTFLASDLDGTLIPPPEASGALAGVDQFREIVRSGGLGLAYVTGRHLALALDGIERSGLPRPVALACDVGTSLYWWRTGEFVLDHDFRALIATTPGVVGAGDVRDSLVGIPGLTLQEPEKQAAFKVSYYTERRLPTEVVDEVERRVAALGRARMVVSLDERSDRGLLDVLPDGVGKATAVAYLRDRLDLAEEALVFAGDSGNDRDALLLPCPSIVVANARASLKADLQAEADGAGTGDRLYFARSPFAGGVVEGLRHFGVRPTAR